MRSHRFTKPYNWKNYKFGIVALVGILSIFGILVVGSAKESLQNKQILGVVIGLAAMIIVSLIDYMWIINFYWVLYILSIIMLTAVNYLVRCKWCNPLDQGRLYPIPAFRTCKNITDHIFCKF